MSRGLRLFADAAPKVANLLEGGFAAERRPEERLRQSFIQALFESGAVTLTEPALGATSEYHPTLPEWPNLPNSRLGGIDLAVRVEGDSDESWRYLAELKWAPLWEQLWDAYKLCHAWRLPGVEETFLIAIATEHDWQREADGSELFRSGGRWTPYLLLERYKQR
jgi:hypothetical protein